MHGHKFTVQELWSFRVDFHLFCSGNVRKDMQFYNINLVPNLDHTRAQVLTPTSRNSAATLLTFFYNPNVVSQFWYKMQTSILLSKLNDILRKKQSFSKIQSIHHFESTFFWVQLVMASPDPDYYNQNLISWNINWIEHQLKH